MKCFIHEKEEARAICTECGKAMCIDCSKQGNHAGVCPVCGIKKYRKKAWKSFFRMALCGIGMYFINNQELINDNLSNKIFVGLMFVGLWFFITFGANIQVVLTAKKALRQGNPLWIKVYDAQYIYQEDETIDNKNNDNS